MRVRQDEHAERVGGIVRGIVCRVKVEILLGVRVCTLPNTSSVLPESPIMRSQGHQEVADDENPPHLFDLSTFQVV